MGESGKGRDEIRRGLEGGTRWREIVAVAHVLRRCLRDGEIFRSKLVERDCSKHVVDLDVLSIMESTVEVVEFGPLIHDTRIFVRNVVVLVPQDVKVLTKALLCGQGHLPLHAHLESKIFHATFRCRLCRLGDVNGTLQLALQLLQLDVLHSRVAAVAEERASDMDIKKLIPILSFEKRGRVSKNGPDVVLIRPTPDDAPHRIHELTSCRIIVVLMTWRCDVRRLGW